MNLIRHRKNLSNFTKYYRKLLQKINNLKTAGQFCAIPSLNSTQTSLVCARLSLVSCVQYKLNIILFSSLSIPGTTYSKY